MLEHENVPGVVESLKVVTEESTARLGRFAFDYARENGRKKVTLVHKAVSRYFDFRCTYKHRRLGKKPIPVEITPIWCPDPS